MSEAYLRAVIEVAVGELCALAEEVQARDLGLAERIWDITNEYLEIPAGVPAPQGAARPQQGGHPK